MHYIRLLICQCLRLCIQVTSFVCGDGKSIFHVGFYQRVVSFVHVKLLKGRLTLYVLVILDSIDVPYMLEENLQHSKVTEHLRHFNIHLSDRKQLY